MSKRFGRNQRRRAREALAAEVARVEALEHARTMDAGLLAKQGRSLEELRARLAEVAYLVGHGSIIAGHPTELTGGFDGMRVVPKKPLAPFEMRGDVLEAVTCEVLRLLEVDVVRDRFARWMHFRVQLSNARAAYGITESAIHGMPVDAIERLLLPQIAADLARLLAQELKR